MSPFRRGAPPAPTSSSAPQHGWAETRVEPASAPDGWAETRVDAQPVRDGRPETRVGAPRVRDGWPETRVDAPPTRDGWSETRVDAPRTRDGWSETRALTALETRILGDADAYLAVNAQDIGRLTGADTRELFVSCDPAEALQQQFEHLKADFIAVHAVGTDASRKLLESVAAASGQRVQKLVIRRQGFGTALAALDFVDVPTAQGTTLRMYAPDTGTEAAVRLEVARTLLAFSRLGVVMVGDLPSAAVAAELRPLGDAMAAGLWQNRQLLLLPLAAASTVVSHGIALGQVAGVAVRTTPQVVSPADAWAFITASWSRFGDPLAAADVKTPAAAASRPMPDVGAAEPPPDAFGRYLRQLGDIAGMIGCCVFDVATGQVVAQADPAVDATQLALQGGRLMTAMGVASRSLGYGRLLPDAAITLGAHHLLLRGVPRHPRLAVHVVLDKHVANLTLARLQLQRMDALFEPPPA